MVRFFAGDFKNVKPPSSYTLLTGRRKPLAPTCTICLIRKDMTPIWCEVTSSIRTVEIPQEPISLDGGSDDGRSRKSGTKVGTKSEDESTPSEPEVPPEKELLLCLRPIRDGEVKMKGKLGFGGICKKKSPPTSPTRSESSKPPKKRRQGDSPSEEPPSKKAATSDAQVADSLMAVEKQANV